MMEVAMFVFVVFIMVLLGLVFVTEIRHFSSSLAFYQIFCLTCDDGHDDGCV